MKKKNGNNRKNNWWTALLFSAFLPIFSIINNGQLNKGAYFGQIVMGWGIIFIFLFVSWHINSFLTFQFESNSPKTKLVIRVLILFVSNMLLLALFIVIGVLVLNDFNELFIRRGNTYLMVSLKGFVGIVTIYIIQYAINSNYRAQEVILQNQILKTENIRAQFEILRQQVNPHFLFNSLSTLRSMIRSNNAKAETFALKLSEIYRQLLSKSEKEMVSLQEELDFVNDYMFMLFARFDGMISMQVEVQDQFMPMKLPTFSLQLLVENCIKHNSISLEKPLTIKIFSTQGGCIIVENNIIPKLSQTEPSGFGLHHLEQRYRMSGIEDGIDVFANETVFRVKIKLVGA